MSRLNGKLFLFQLSRKRHFKVKNLIDVTSKSYLLKRILFYCILNLRKPNLNLNLKLNLNARRITKLCLISRLGLKRHFVSCSFYIPKPFSLKKIVIKRIKCHMWECQKSVKPCYALLLSAKFQSLYTTTSES